MQPRLLSPDQMQANSYAQDRSLQNFYNQNAQNATNAYNTDSANANQAQGQLQDFTKNMQSGTDIYAKQLQAGNQNAGYDVNNLNQAQNQVSQLTGILGGLPRAVQASNANYGATAGNVASQYSTEGANLNQSLQLANQNTQNQLQKQQAGLTGAQQGTTAGIQTQAQELQGYTSAAQNAAQIMSTAQTQMSQMIAAEQQGQKLTADDQNTFAQLKAAYASAAASYADAQLKVSQAKGQDQSNLDFANAMAHGQTPGSKVATAPTANQGVSQSNQASNGITGNQFINQIGSDYSQYGVPGTFVKEFGTGLSNILGGLRL